MEKLEVRGPWSVTEADSVEPKGGGPDRTEIAREEKLKEDETEADVGPSQGESVETTVQKGKVVRVESEETQDYVWRCWQSVWKKQRNSPLCRALGEPR